MQTNSNFLLSNPDELKASISFADLEFFVEHFNSKRTRENPNIGLALQSLSDMTTMNYDTTGKPALSLDELYDTTGSFMYDDMGEGQLETLQISPTFGVSDELRSPEFLKSTSFEEKDLLQRNTQASTGYYIPGGTSHSRKILVKDEKGNINEQYVSDYFPKIGMIPLEDLKNESDDLKLAEERNILLSLGYDVPSKERMNFIRKNLLERLDEIFRHEDGHHAERMIENYLFAQDDFFEKDNIKKTYDVFPDKQVELSKLKEQR